MKTETRKDLINYIRTYAGDEIETKSDALKLAEMTKKELKEIIKSIKEYYKIELNLLI